jgi:hypothetical protein
VPVATASSIARVRAEDVEHRGAGRALGDVALQLRQQASPPAKTRSPGGEVVEDRLPETSAATAIWRP